jgi:beta-phosphoglucomutase
MINTIIFDAEGVVVDSEVIWDEEQKIFLNRRGYIYDRDKIKHLVTGQSLRESTATIQKFYGFNESMDNMLVERKAVMCELLESQITFINGFKDFFEQISDSYSVCIATSLDRDILTFIDRKLKLFELFNGNVFSISDVNYISKPKPDIFLYSAKKMKVNPLNCVVIEDSPHGIEAARQACMKCIALTTTYEAEKLTSANLVVSSYKEINLDSI